MSRDADVAEEIYKNSRKAGVQIVPQDTRVLTPPPELQVGPTTAITFIINYSDTPDVNMKVMPKPWSSHSVWARLSVGVYLPVCVGGLGEGPFAKCWQMVTLSLMQGRA